MDWDDIRPKQTSGSGLGADLSGLSIAELEHRIGELKAEIARVTAEMERKRAHEAAASAFFKF